MSTSTTSNDAAGHSVTMESLKQKSEPDTVNGLHSTENQNNSNILNEQSNLTNGEKSHSNIHLQSEKSVSNSDKNYDNTNQTDLHATAENNSESMNNSESDDDLPPLEDRVDKNKELDEDSHGTGNSLQNDSKENNPDKVKENDVKDECFHEKDQKDAKENEEKEEEEEYLDILGNGLLKRKILKEGSNQENRPQHSDIVTINLEGRLEDGSIVDKLVEFSFPLGEGDVINALDLGVTLMIPGQIIELITDAKYAYGSLGREPDIPKDSKITYTIELLKIESPPDLDKMSAGERLQYGEKKRERGNELFKREDFVGAINSYTKAVKILDPEMSSDSTEVLQQILDSRIKCYNNMAACQLKVNAFDAAAKSCKMVLVVQPENVKALFRMGKALASKGETKEALQYLRKAQKLEPDTKIINQELMRLSKKLNAEKQSEINMYQKMLGTSQKSTPAKAKAQSKNNSWMWTTVAGGVLVSLIAMSIAAYRHLQH